METAGSGAAAQPPVWRTAIQTGLGMGWLIGWAEVGWAYYLPILYPTRTYYLPIEKFWVFVLTALVVDVVLVTTGALVLAAILASLLRILPRARSFSHWVLLCRWLIVGGSSATLYLYWFGSYIMNMREPGKEGIRAASTLAVLLASLGICWLVGRLSRNGRPAGVIAWGLVTAGMGLAILSGFQSYREAHSESKPEVSETARRSARGPNIVLFTLDTLRFDYLGCYGHPVVKTPHLDALAGDGILFESAIAHAPNTTPSHASMMTSLYPSGHRALNGIAMRTDVPTVAELLSGSGYQNAAFVSSTSVRSIDSGLHRGFDSYEDSLVPWSTFFGRDEVQQLAFFQTIDMLAGTDISGDVVTDRAVGWLRDREERPFFLWVHYFDAHSKYDNLRSFTYFFSNPPDYDNPYLGKFDQSLSHVDRREAYGGRVTYTDNEVGRVLSELRSLGLYDDALIIATSDHGDAFGEMHGELEEWSHGWHIFDTSQRVPLIVKPPRSTRGGERISRQVQLVDLAPTLLEVTGLPIPESFEGTSLNGLLNGEDRGPPEIAYIQRVAHDDSGLSKNWKASKNMMALRTPQAKYICNNLGEDEQLYDLEADPGETINIVAQHPEEAAGYRSLLFEKLRPDEDFTPPDMDPNVLEKLQALGYLIENEAP